MRILHITYWYPNETEPFQALWIRRLIQSCSAEYQKVVHLNVEPSSKLKWKKSFSKEVDSVMVRIPTKRWVFAEIISFFILKSLIRKMRVKDNFDLVVFHIAYPNLIFVKRIIALVGSPICVFEHWSAYHFNFGVKGRLSRIQNIFQHQIPVLAVSRALISDILNFSGGSFKTYVIPNLVDTEKFVHRESELNCFLMVSQWKYPKRPEVMLQAWSQFCKIFPNERLVIVGYGEQEMLIVDMIDDLGLRNSVSFVGSKDPEWIAAKLNNSKALLHCSDYETFSVICAEALCSGTPVVASGVGGIIEFLDDTNGILVSSNEVQTWKSALISFMELKYDRNLICKSARSIFNKYSIGKQIDSAYNEIVSSQR